jgi:hypothetical protein
MEIGLGMQTFITRILLLVVEDFFFIDGNFFWNANLTILKLESLNVSLL